MQQGELPARRVFLGVRERFNGEPVHAVKFMVKVREEHMEEGPKHYLFGIILRKLFWFA
jgi:hypothetical protein